MGSVANATMPGQAFKCNSGKSLKVLKQQGKESVFQYGSMILSLRDSTPYGANFKVYGDTQSPSATGISFSRSIFVLVNGREDECR
jgi:hypothetical protein